MIAFRFLCLVDVAEAQLEKVVTVSYQDGAKWSVPTSQTVEFITGEELERKGMRNIEKGKVFTALQLPDKTTAIVQLEIPRGATVFPDFDTLDYLCLFIRTGSIEGIQVNGAKGTRWKFSVQWPSPPDQHQKLRQIERKATGDDRVIAGECSLRLGDLEGAARHFRLAVRELRKKGDNLGTLQATDLEIQVSRHLRAGTWPK